MTGERELRLPSMPVPSDRSIFRTKWKPVRSSKMRQPIEAGKVRSCAARRWVARPNACTVDVRVMSETCFQHDGSVSVEVASSRGPILRAHVSRRRVQQWSGSCRRRASEGGRIPEFYPRPAAPLPGISSSVSCSLNLPDRPAGGVLRMHARGQRRVVVSLPERRPSDRFQQHVLFLAERQL
jgi:hypothetical protein